MFKIRYLIKEGNTTYQFNNLKEWVNMCKTLKSKDVSFKCWQELEMFRR